MKQQFLVLKTMVLWVTTLATSSAVAQTIAARLTPEFKWAEKADESFFYHNPLTINDNPLIFHDFSVISRGILALVSGNPATSGATKIPFRAYLQRGDKRIELGISNTTQVDLAPVMALAKPGDYLIVEPTRKSDWQGKRIIPVRESPFVQNWISFLTKPKDGC